MILGTDLSRLAPLSSIETEIGGINSFVRNICKTYPDLYGGEDVHLINHREALVTFESNRHLFLPNGSLFSSNAQTTRLLLKNISLLKSRGISPSSFSSQLSSLYQSKDKDIYYQKYSALATVYSLFDQWLQDHGLITESDVLQRVLNDQVILDSIAKQYSHLFVLSIETLSPIQNQFFASLLSLSPVQSALLTQHMALTSSDLIDPSSYYPSVSSLTLPSSCFASSYIDLLNRRYGAASGEFTKKQIDEWKEAGKPQMERMKVITWDQTSSSNCVHVSDFYSGVDEQEAIVEKLKSLFATPLSRELPSIPAGLASESSIQQIKQYLQNRTGCVAGVFFKSS